MEQIVSITHNKCKVTLIPVLIVTINSSFFDQNVTQLTLIIFLTLNEES